MSTLLRPHIAIKGAALGFCAMNSETPKRNTQQRKAIEKVFHNTERPLSIDELLSEGRVHSPTLNKATVYRNLKALLESGTISKVEVPSKGIFYETNNKGHHHHFLCRLCNKAFDLLGCLLKNNRSLAPKGFVVEDHELVVHGVCPDCTKGS